MGIEKVKKTNKNKTMDKNLVPHNFGRHGEVILKPIKEIPIGAKLIESKNSVIVGHSESGHHHVLTAERGAAIGFYEIDGKVYLDLPAKATLEHQKTIERHETQVFTPGKYERVIRHSYSYGGRVMKRVQD